LVYYAYQVLPGVEIIWYVVLLGTILKVDEKCRTSRIHDTRVSKVWSV